MMLYVPYGIYDSYCTNYRTENGSLPYNTQYEKFRIDGFQNITVAPSAFMNDSGRVALTPQNNMKMGTDLTSDFNKIEIVRQIRLWQIAMHYVLGYQIADTEAIWVNDQA